MAWRAGEALLLAFAVAVRFAALRNYIDVAGGADPVEREALHNTLSAGAVSASYMAFVFLALGSVAFFHLLYRSRFLPRLLSGFAVLASVTMLAIACAYLVFPTQVSALGLVGMAPMFVAEVAIGLWLLVKGANLRHWRDTAEART